MRLEKLEIKGFGKFENLTLELRKGFNIIYGNNESGKSTLQSFIKAMLYGVKNGRFMRDASMSPLNRFRPWKGENYSGFMDYSLDSGEWYRIQRNFNNNTVRIFDRLFKDITDTFEINKEKSRLFAEKHLGLNDKCFEKTVFIRQMDATIDEEGNRELINRLINISQTGFEEISFRKAEIALKDAIKSNIGTDKTSKRPLDKVQERLCELKSIQQCLLESKQEILDLESELNACKKTAEEIEKIKLILKKQELLLGDRRRIKQLKEQQYELEAILDKLKCDEEEAKLISEKVKEFNEEKEAYTRFASFNNEDVDEVFIKHQKLSSLKDESVKINSQIKNKKNELELLESQLEPLKVFESLNTNVESEVLELNKEIENLKQEQNKTDIQVLNDKIQSIGARQKRITGFLIFSLLFLSIPIGAFFYSKILSVIAGIVLVPIIIGLFIYRVKLSNEHMRVLSEKRISFVSVNSINEEVGKKRARIENILKLANVRSVEEFFRLKIIYDSKLQHLIEMNNEIACMESELQLNVQRMATVKRDILERLMVAGIIDGVSTEITDAHIKEFKFGISRFNALEPGINYSLQRLNDLHSNIVDKYQRASEILNLQETDKMQVSTAIENRALDIGRLEEKNNDLHLEIVNLLNEMGRSDSVIQTILEHLQHRDLNDLDAELDKSKDDLEKDLNQCLMRKTELETRLKDLLQNEGEDIQSVHEEIITLEEMEKQLIDMGKSLNIALDVLQEASLEIQRDYIPFINDKMSGYIEKMTGGRYDHLKADNRLMLKVIAPETGEVVAASLLSSGTLDQMYLALRLAMADLIELNSQRLPIIMDEVFAQYDDCRMGETLQLIKMISEQRQIVLFTCKDREIEIAKEICGNNLNVVKLN